MNETEQMHDRQEDHLNDLGLDGPRDGDLSRLPQPMMPERPDTTPEQQMESEALLPQESDKQEKRTLAALLRDTLEFLRQEGMAFLLLGVLALIAGGTWYAIGRSVDAWVRGLLAGGLLLIATYVLLRPQDLRRAFAGRSVRYGSNALILSIATIGVVALLNYLSTRYYKRFDVTEGNLHTLSPESIQIVKALDQPIEVVGVYPSGQDQDRFERWLDEYRAHTDVIQYRTIDPIRQPGEADRLGWTAYGGGLVVQRGSRSQQVRTADEQDITSALLKVSRDVSKVVYFLTGHNEPSITGYEDDDYGQLGALLEVNNYQVRTLNLAITDTVPADAALLVIAGPETPLLEGESALIRDYLWAGGKALMLADPGPETGLNDVLAPWQVGFENKLVVDAGKGLSGDPITPVIDRYQYSQITKDLPMVALPMACPIVQQEGDAAGTGYTPLAQTSSQSWGDVDWQENQELAFDEDRDSVGPLTLIATVDLDAAQPGERTRLVLVGDSDFVMNDILAQIPNGQFLFLNAVNWLAEEEALVAIGPKTNVPRSIRMTMVQEGVVCFGSLIFIPVVILAAGVALWLKRR
jgi:ABC-type uncharacterized transport system involved in gliding motility auxiliary subunit